MSVELRYATPATACMLACLALAGGCKEPLETNSPTQASGVIVAAANDDTNANADANAASPGFVSVGEVRASQLDEISGIQAGFGDDWWVHTDDGKAEVYAINTRGEVEATIELRGSENKDWEDLTRIPGADGPLMVIADSGDNHAQRKHISLYFYPLPGRNNELEFPDSLDLLHAIKLRYPDGKRDCEAVAFDPASERILFITKRDVPPRIYGIETKQALAEPEAELEFLGEMTRLRPPTPMDLLRDPSRGAWISQPTGMDISPDGRLAAIITYRSLYLFQRQPQETWPAAFLRKPIEIEGPPGKHDEGVGFSPDQTRLIVIGENLPAPIYQLDLTNGLPDQPGSMP